MNKEETEINFKILDVFESETNYSRDKGRFVEVEDKKQHLLQVRLNSIQKELLEYYLKKTGVKASHLIRSIIGEHLADCSYEKEFLEIINKHQ